VAAGDDGAMAGGLAPLTVDARDDGAADEAGVFDRIAAAVEEGMGV